MNGNENGITYSVTNYTGYEEEAIRVLNLTRNPPKEPSHMQWRYRGLKTPHEPLVFWAKDSNGIRIGMDAIIFRKYWVNNEVRYIAVGGDMSVSPEHSGKGIAKSLVHLKTKEMEQRRVGVAIAISNPASAKIHSYAGWERNEEFIRHTYIINPEKKINKYVKIKKIGKIVGRVWRRFAIYNLRKRPNKDIVQDSSWELDDMFDEFWASFHKEGCIIGDRSRDSLIWRYKNHPVFRFNMIKYIQDEAIIGYIIYRLTDNGICRVYDLVGKDNDDIQSIITLYLNDIAKNEEIEYVWIDLNKGHPYSDILSRSGFARRIEKTYFLSYNTGQPNIDKKSKWFLTNGDKDI